MPKKKPLVIVTRRLPNSVETRLRELFDARLNDDDRAMSQAELIDAVKSAEVIVPTVTDRIDEAVLSQAGEQMKLSPILATVWTISTSATRPSAGSR
jgi:glyoxylate reductase